MQIGITLGDPAGIGPELIVRTLARLRAHPEISPIVYGDRRVLEEIAEACGVVPPERLVEVTTLPAFIPGQPNETTGRAQIAYLEAAVADARAGKISALITAPIHKASALAAGFGFPGHTEFLAARLGDPGRPLPVTMLFAGPRMRVALATIHRPLASVSSALTVDRLAGTLCRTALSLRREFALEAPRIAVAGLNPHAGEGGHFGDEETRVIGPAIEAARHRLPASVQLTGPLVPDVVFRQHLDGRFDAVVALYHDQGLIPVKLIDFEEAVNVTLGLPIVRTSPDHGVAHDLAGLGTRGRPMPAHTGEERPVRVNSFAAALTLAMTLATNAARA